MKYNAVVGVSVNSELELVVKNTPGPKKELRSMGYCLSGSSGNVAMALKRLGGRPHLLGLVTARHQGTLADKLLDEAIKESGVPFTPIRVLSETNVGVIPIIGETNGVVWGKRNHVVHFAVPNALWDITRPEIGIGPRTFTVVTGLRRVETVFAKTLLARTSAGFRVLNAKDTLCSRRDFKKILPLVDLLVLNQHEFKETGMSLVGLHNCGPNIIVVTHDKKGGMFSFCPGFSSKFNAVDFPGGRFETGAGDWFLGALVAELIRLKKSVFEIEPEQFQKVVDFAARVAGKKITFAGGGNGPSRLQLRS